MRNPTYVHSGSRWEPLPHTTAGSAAGPSAGALGAARSNPTERASTRRSGRGPRVLVATILSALAVGGVGAGVAVARTDASDPSSSTTGTAGVSSGQHAQPAPGDHGRHGDRPAR